MGILASARISVDDLSRLFDVVELCSVSPDTLTEENPPASPVPPPSSTWTISEHEGFWAPGSSAGGSRKYKRAFQTLYPSSKRYLCITLSFALGSFWTNPQFQLVLRERDQPDDGDEEDEEDEEGEEVDGDDSDEESAEEERAEKQKQKSKRCTVLVELLQKNRRQRDKVHFLYIAFHVYKVAAPPLLAVRTRSLWLRTDSPTVHLCHPLLLQVPSDVSVSSSAASDLLWYRKRVS